MAGISLGTQSRQWAAEIITEVIQYLKWKIVENSWEYFFDLSQVCQRDCQSSSLWPGTSLFMVGEAGSWKAEVLVPLQ